MINEASIKRHIGNNRIFERGENIFRSNDVGDLMVFDQESSGLTEIETWVNSSSGYDEYQVRVLLGKMVISLQKIVHVLTSKITLNHANTSLLFC